MKTETTTIRVSVAWWLKFYFYGLAITAAITGLEIDEDKVNRVINRALRFKVQR